MEQFVMSKWINAYASKAKVLYLALLLCFVCLQSLDCVVSVLLLPIFVHQFHSTRQSIGGLVIDADHAAA
jgi:hypothetical protein